MITQTQWLTGITCILILSGCLEVKKSAWPQNNPNPWKDDYTSVSSMEQYRDWGTYNVHDPSCRKVGDTYYMYSTDAIYGEDKLAAQQAGVPLGFIQVRKSNDLVNWDFSGWAFSEIPEEAIEHVRRESGGEGATNIWAPYMIQYKDKFRLYYCVSAFGKSTSFLGMAESDSPEGPWIQKGAVVTTDNQSEMNAIDPSVAITDHGEHWMVYGSYFGGLYEIQLDPETGLSMRKGDKGHCIARRANGSRDNIEAPEIIYNPELKMYYLFVSYDPLMTTYNLRVGRSEHPEGPFLDMFGNDMRDESNNYPILTHPYRFNNHTGWAGTAHCGVINDNGNFYVMHQGRLSPQNRLMDLHVRELFWTKSGWPALSPQRYANVTSEPISIDDFIGNWEIITIQPALYNRSLSAGQILWGEGDMQEDEVNVSARYTFECDGRITGKKSGTWSYEPDGRLQLSFSGEMIEDLIPHIGQDWENEKKTILFTGLTKDGFSLWGKRIE